jgi:hypothetical protein
MSRTPRTSITITFSPQDADRLEVLVHHMQGLTSRSALARLAFSRGLTTLAESVPTLQASKPVPGPSAGQQSRKPRRPFEGLGRAHVPVQPKEPVPTGPTTEELMDAVEIVTASERMGAVVASIDHAMAELDPNFIPRPQGEPIIDTDSPYIDELDVFEPPEREEDLPTPVPEADPEPEPEDDFDWLQEAVGT